ncbi:MAG: histidine phosphatase family protein [Acidimicrobiales bacterium]|nr:histidine phosphatase family protein [Acidimicrobiales bacterium]
MATLRYLSHPEVVIDPAVPVPEWGLSDVGRRRTADLADRATWLPAVERIVTSGERKAIETGEILAARLGLEVERRPSTDEIDRSATGYLPHDEHEAQANRLFAQPEASANGWERAVDAQARVVAGLGDIFAGDETVVVVGHGGVGTLLWCRLAGRPIAREHDQPFGGHLYAVDLSTQRPDGPWRSFEDGV